MFRLLALCLFIASAQAVAPPAKPWQRIESCRWKADRWNDGDSFHVITGDEGREIVVRLYFVDTPEAETAYRDRLDEQAAYFGITREQATEIAHEAAAFTKQRLASPFTVWTRWRSALGRSALGRVYCIIITDTGDDLNELLVSHGFARIYGTKTALYDGMGSLPICAATLHGVRCPRGPHFKQVTGYPENPTTIGEMIRKRRLDLNLRQEDVAKTIGCNKMTIVNWEKGHASPRINHMVGVVKFLGFSPFPSGDNLARKVVDHRRSLGITQKEFARRLGVDPSTLARWERGEREPRGRYASAVSEWLQTTTLSRNRR